MNAKNKPVIIGFYGSSGSGKTTLVEKLICSLTKQGFRIGAVKKTNQSISIDQPGKDTWRYSEAGAKTVVFSTSLETSFIQKRQMNEKDICEILLKMSELDFIFIEGASEISTSKIRLGGSEIREKTLFTYSGDFEALIEFVKKLHPEVNMDEIKLVVNEKEVRLSDFPRSIIISTIMGMLQALKDIDADEIKTVEIKIDKK